MDFEIFFYYIITALVYGFFYLEARLHNQNLQRIKLRIHVNGTRGKSSVTRLIAAGLRAGGVRVYAKTTGTKPQLILPDGTEQPIIRKGLPNIRENIRIIKMAASAGADAIVIECMALQPELQRICEHRLIKSHIGVITNVRLDHEDVMGNGIHNVAMALSNTIPQEGKLVTTKKVISLFKFVGIVPQDTITIERELLDFASIQEFSYPVIPENVAIALQVCKLAGIMPSVAVKGMQEAPPDSGNVTISDIQLGGKYISIINAFAANDPESTLMLWNMYVRRQNADKILILLNCRSDRKFRTAQLCRALTKVHTGLYIITGDTTAAFSLLIKKGVSPENLYPMACQSGNYAFKQLSNFFADLPDERYVVFAAGNIKGAIDIFNTEKAVSS